MSGDVRGRAPLTLAQRIVIAEMDDVSHHIATWAENLLLDGVPQADIYRRLARLAEIAYVPK